MDYLFVNRPIGVRNVDKVDKLLARPLRWLLQMPHCIESHILPTQSSLPTTVIQLGNVSIHQNGSDETTLLLIRNTFMTTLHKCSAAQWNSNHR